MVGRSNAITRENCRAQDVDDEPSKLQQRGTLLDQWPRPAAHVSHADGNELSDTGNRRMKRPGRSQSSRSSEEAVQHNAVERRGAGR